MWAGEKGERWKNIERNKDKEWEFGDGRQKQQIHKEFGKFIQDEGRRRELGGDESQKRRGDRDAGRISREKAARGGLRVRREEIGRRIESQKGGKVRTEGRSVRWNRLMKKLRARGGSKRGREKEGK